MKRGTASWQVFAAATSLLISCFVLSGCSTSADPEREVTEVETSSIAQPDAFWSEVRRLPRRQAQTVALAYVYGMSVAEIAATLEVSPGTVKTHLSRGRAALAQTLGRTDEETPT